MIASAVISALGTAASGIMSFVNNRKAQQTADAEYARQQAYNEARAAENPLSRSENQAVINEYDRKAKQQVETARNRNKILGGTQEMDLATQQAVADGRASLMSGISAQASANADKYRDRAEAAREAKFANDQARTEARNQTFAALASNAANAMSGLYADGGGDAAADPEMDAAVQQARLAAADKRGAAVNQSAATDKGLAESINAQKAKIDTGVAAANQRAVGQWSASSAQQANARVLEGFDANGNPVYRNTSNVFGLKGDLLRT